MVNPPETPPPEVFFEGGLNKFLEHKNEIGGWIKILYFKTNEKYCLKQTKINSNFYFYLSVLMV